MTAKEIIKEAGAASKLFGMAVKGAKKHVASKGGPGFAIVDAAKQLGRGRESNLQTLATFANKGIKRLRKDPSDYGELVRTTDRIADTGKKIHKSLTGKDLDYVDAAKRLHKSVTGKDLNLVLKG